MIEQDRPCVRIFGESRGAALHRFVSQRDEKGTCPCDRGKRCPLLDAAGLSPLLPSQDSRRSAEATRSIA